MSFRRSFACVLAASAGAWAACSDGSSTTPTPPPPCTRCPFGAIPTKAIATPPACNPDEDTLPYEPCELHICCAPKDGGPCEGPMTVDCVGGTTCTRSPAEGGLGRAVCVPHDERAAPCGKISCLDPCYCRSAPSSTCTCP